MDLFRISQYQKCLYVFQSLVFYTSQCSAVALGERESVLFIGTRLVTLSPRLFAHATDTDDAVTPPTAVSDCLGARAAKNRQQLKLGKGA